MPSQPGFGTVWEGAAAAPVAVLDHGYLPLRELLDDEPPDRLIELVRDWSRHREALRSAYTTVADRDLRPLEAATWLPPLRPGKILCVGSNYHDHVAEMTGPAGLSVRPQPFPFTFLKPSTSLAGSGAEVRRPSYGHKLDWEAELAVVVGDPSLLGGDDPLRAVFGYAILNDLSLRDFIPFPHTLGLDAVVSKGFDGAAPFGPWITLAEDVPDPQELQIGLSVNGEVMQNGTTENMIFDVRQLLEHYAGVLTLEPGDVIATGTPAGVGAARSPQRFLAAGDRVEASISGLGTLVTLIGEPISDRPLPRVVEESH